MAADFRIVDHGRGSQLSTCRITVQDIVPYFQEGCPAEEILRWIPGLARQEIEVVEQYIRDNHDEVMEIDRRIRQRNELRKNSPEVEQILEEGRAERLALLARLKAQPTNGARL